MSQSQYITETHPLMDDFDIEAQEAAEAAPPETATEEAQEPTEAPTEPAPAGEAVPTAEAPQQPEAPTEPEVDANPDDLTDIVGPDGKYLTYKEAAKATRSLQSMYDKKFAEQQKQLLELQEQNTQWAQYQQRLQAQQQEYAQQQQVQQQVASMTSEQWAYQIDMYPAQTLEWAAENYPEAVSGIITHIRQTKGNHAADELMLRHQESRQQQLIQQQAEQMQMLQQSTQMQNDIPRNIELAMRAVNDKYGEQFNEMQDHVSAAIQSGNYQIDFSDPANIAGAVEHAYLASFREQAIQQNQNNAAQPTEVLPQAETGNPGQAGQPATAEDQIADEIVDYWNSNPYSR